jgi:hypothetical protein
MATVSTAASERNVASSPRPLLVVEKLCLVTRTEPSGSTTRAHATTVSRCTSSPPTRSRIRFITITSIGYMSMEADRGRTWRSEGWDSCS